MNNKGFTLMDCLIGLFIMVLAIQLLVGFVSIVYKRGGIYIDENIQKEWFYTD